MNGNYYYYRPCHISPCYSAILRSDGWLVLLAKKKSLPPRPLPPQVLLRYHLLPWTKRSSELSSQWVGKSWGQTFFLRVACTSTVAIFFADARAHTSTSGSRPSNLDLSTLPHNQLEEVFARSRGFVRGCISRSHDAVFIGDDLEKNGLVAFLWVWVGIHERGSAISGF